MLIFQRFQVDYDWIKIVMKDGLVKDIASASDISNVSALSKTVKKNFVCYAF